MASQALEVQELPILFCLLVLHIPTYILYLHFQECDVPLRDADRTSPRIHPLIYFLAHPEEDSNGDWCPTETKNLAKVFVYYGTSIFPSIEWGNYFLNFTVHGLAFFIFFFQAQAAGDPHGPDGQSRSVFNNNNLKISYKKYRNLFQAALLASSPA